MRILFFMHVFLITPLLISYLSYFPICFPDAEDFDRISSKRERTKDQVKREKQLSNNASRLNGHILPSSDSNDAVHSHTRRSHTITSAENSPAPLPVNHSENVDKTPTSHTPTLRATPERKYVSSYKPTHFSWVVDIHSNNILLQFPILALSVTKSKMHAVSH